MLSEIHNANFITFWLTEWIRLGGIEPKEFICDMSFALLNAGVRAFAKEWTVNDYINTVFNLKNAEESGLLSINVKVPKCFIRIDIAHLMKNVATSKALQNQPKKAKDFFIRCIAILVKMNSLEEAKDHIKSVLIVAYSKTEGKLKILERFSEIFIFKITISTRFLN